MGRKARAALDGADGQLVALQCEAGLEPQVGLMLGKIRGSLHESGDRDQTDADCKLAARSTFGEEQPPRPAARVWRLQQVARSGPTHPPPPKKNAQSRNPSLALALEFGIPGFLS